MVGRHAGYVRGVYGVYRVYLGCVRGVYRVCTVGRHIHREAYTRKERTLRKEAPESLKKEE